MHIFRTRRAVLVESYNGVEQEHEVAFDDELWGRVCECVGEFVGDLLFSADAVHVDE